MNICGMRTYPQKKITSTKALRKEHAWPAEETAKRLVGWEQNKLCFSLNVYHSGQGLLFARFFN